MYAVHVVFELKPEHVAAFQARVIRQASDSLALEPGCRRFDAWSDAARPELVHLYELYDDAAAFDAHLGSAHFAAFDAEVAEMIALKTVTRLDRPLFLTEGETS